MAQIRVSYQILYSIRADEKAVSNLALNPIVSLVSLTPDEKAHAVLSCPIRLIFKFSGI